MERSKSCTHFETSVRSANNNNSNDNQIHIINNSNNKCSRTNSLHQQYQHQQQQQSWKLHQSQLQHEPMFPNASSETLHTIPLPSTVATAQTQLGISRSVSSGSSSSTLPRNACLRKKQLQRQASIAQYIGFHNDNDYYADLEEDALTLKPLVQQSLRQHHPARHLRRLHFSQQKTHNECTFTVATGESSGKERHTLYKESTESLNSAPASQRRQRFADCLTRDSSVHSDSSRYSSVDSLLEARKPDPEAILINLGFGPPAGSEDILSRIPKRFLKPSQVHGIDTDAFVKRLQLASNLADSSVLGYRGLTGNPDVPPSSIVAKIMERFKVNQRKKPLSTIE